MNIIDDIINRYKRLCENNNLDKAIIKTIPHIGTFLYEYYYGADNANLIKELSSKSEKNHAEIIEKLETELNRNTEKNLSEILDKLEVLLKNKENTSLAILAIGSGNAEYILKCKGDLSLG